LVGPACFAPRRSLRLLLVAWWGGTLLSLGPLLFTNQTVRWSVFLYPALCLSAGPLFARLWRRGSAGRLVTAPALAFLIWSGCAFWSHQWTSTCTDEADRPPWATASRMSWRYRSPPQIEPSAQTSSCATLALPSCANRSRPRLSARVG
jgi:hypothetical protein